MRGCLTSSADVEHATELVGLELKGDTLTGDINLTLLLRLDPEPQPTCLRPVTYLVQAL